MRRRPSRTNRSRILGALLGSTFLSTSFQTSLQATLAKPDDRCKPWICLAQIWVISLSFTMTKVG